MPRLPLAAITLIPLLCLLAACPPTYPKCDKDEHCKENEYCVNGLCQQCREDQHCPKGHYCKEGRCEPKEGYCETTEDCPDGKACQNNQCIPCKSDGDCGPGYRCSNGKCLTPGQCVTDDDCPENHECQNGTCVAPPPDTSGEAPCTPQTVYFGFDEFVLSATATQKLQEGAKCLQSVPGRTIRLEGHCDPRGTEEYNLALGDRRAQAVKRYLERMGVSNARMRAVSKGKLEATGTAASSWAMDRKVQFFWE
jgi:peptidoglycan-associated lipoprotein